MEAWGAPMPRIRVGYCALVICTVIVWLWLIIPSVAVTVRVVLPTAVPEFPPPPWQPLMAMVPNESPTRAIKESNLGRRLRLGTTSSNSPARLTPSADFISNPPECAW